MFLFFAAFFTVDYICVLYGTPSAYGVVTMPFSVREGINIFLAGFVPTENLRFRDEELNFKLATSTGKTSAQTKQYDKSLTHFCCGLLTIHHPRE